MTILGISCYYHDAAAAVIGDGKILAAAEEERFSRIKHDSGFPKHAIDFCLSYAPSVDFVVFYEKPFRKFHRIMTTSLRYYPQSYASFTEAMRVWLTKKLWIKQEIAMSVAIDPNKILFTEHHLSHAASCFYPSPFNQAAILTVDGVGEWATATMGTGSGNKIEITRQLVFPHSVGLLYSAFTAYLGFEVNEGEWKVMGLAPYGKPRYVKDVWKTVKRAKDGSITLDLTYFSFHYSDQKSFSQKLVDLFGPPIAPAQAHEITKRAADIAASIQVVTEEIMLAMAKNLHKNTGLSNLCLAGGVALNSVANYRMLRESGFGNIWIQPAAGDSGGALGAALYVYHHILNKKRTQPMNNAYFGREYDDKEIASKLKSMNIEYKKLSYRELVGFVAHELSAGRVVGWMQDRFEWGPRALGNRSILADPRNPRMKEIINSKVKFREAFRPFAPSVLAEYAKRVFSLPQNPRAHQPLNYMLYVVPVRASWKSKVPAITHADGSSRPQLVYKTSNPLYHQLITAFYKRTGVPLLLNTSFNLKGEPIVATPADALGTFLASGIDILVMGNYVCVK